MDEVQQGSRPNSTMSEEEVLVDSLILSEQSLLLCEEPTSSVILISRLKATKRRKSDNCVDGEGFTLVQRNKKQKNRSKIINEKYEVSVSSYNLLPKRVGKTVEIRKYR